MNQQIDELHVRYDVLCKAHIQTGTPCEINFQDITNKVAGPVYVYYELGQFYQNHRRYVKSREDKQLAGNYLSVSELSNCDPIIQVGDLWYNQKKSVSGVMLKDKDPAIPCGLVAKSFFNDTFKLFRKFPNGTRKEIDIH
jgi:hypothetical protein